MKIRTQLFLGSLSFFVLVIGVFIANQYFFTKQDRDALVINLAGRQRMLSQKMSKEALLYVQSPTQSNRDALQRTVKIFKTTHAALLQGGSAPLSLDDSNYQAVPASADAQFTQRLKKLGERWGVMDKALQQLLCEDDKEKKAGVRTVVLENPLLLVELNEMVSTRQKASESWTGALFALQWISVFIGLLLVGVFAWIGHKIGKTVNALTKAAEQISMGEIDQPIQIEASGELDELKQAFERMRKSTQKAIAAMESDLS